MTRRDQKFENSNCHSVDQLMAAFGPGDRRELRALKKRMDLAPGNFLVKAGEKPGQIFVHRRGTIRTISPEADLTSIYNREGGPKWVYGITEVLSGKGFDFSIEAISVAEFDVISNKDFLEFIRRRPELIHRLSIGPSKLYGHALETLREN